MITQIDVSGVLARVGPDRRDLVTRPTGRAVRTSIEMELSQLADVAVVVLDFTDVRLMDLSCADEVVAKLLHAWVGPDAPSPSVCFLVRGHEHHIEYVEEVLCRQQLALVAESEGAVRIIGEVADPCRATFEKLAARGRAAAEDLAADLSWPLEQVQAALAELETRRCILEEAGHYLPPHAA